MTPTAPTSAVDPDELAEDEEMRRSDTIPEQRQWRMEFAMEQHDDAWTEQVMQELTRQSQGLHGAVRLSDLSCRQTLCRMHLQFADQLDARAFISAPRDPELRYQFQTLDPEFDGAGFDRSDFTYELLIKRSPQAPATAVRSKNLPEELHLDGVAQQAVEAAIVLAPRND